MCRRISISSRNKISAVLLWLGPGVSSVTRNQRLVMGAGRYCPAM